METNIINLYNSELISNQIKSAKAEFRLFSSVNGDRMIIPSSFIILADDKKENNKYSVLDDTNNIEKYFYYSYLDNVDYSIDYLKNVLLKFINTKPYTGDLIDERSLWELEGINTGNLSNSPELWPFMISKCLSVSIGIRDGYIENFSIDFIRKKLPNGRIRSNTIYSSDSVLMGHMPYEDQYIKLSHIVIDLP